MEPSSVTSLGGSLLVPSVQELAKEPSLTTVPTRYLREYLDNPPSAILRPSLSCLVSSDQVPVIDMQCLLSEDTSSSNNELEKLHLACKDWGFFQMINHGVSSSLLEKLKVGVQEFFNLPMEEKKKFWQDEKDIQGFGQVFVVSEDQKLDWADMFYLLTLPHHMRKPHLFPRLPLPFRDTLEEYSREIKDISLKTLIFIAKALKMEVEEMKVLFDEGIQSMRMNYYPPCPQPEKVIGLSPHSDSLGITFLLPINEVEGLQIKKDGIWKRVESLPDAFVVNVGDILEIVTNGLYKSIEHRATVNSEKERLSVATFVGPKLDAEVGPAPSLITPEAPPRFSRVPFVAYYKKLLTRELNGRSNVEQYYI